MVRTDRYLAVHLPKTGGTWLRYVLRDLAGGEHVGTTHAPLRRAGVALRAGRQVIGTVRDPFRWYASLYAYCRATSDDQPSESILAYGNGRDDFRSFLRGVTDPRTVRALPRALGVIVVPPASDPATELLESGVGLCSWMHDLYYGPGCAGLDIALRTSRLAQDLLERTGIDARHRAPANPRRDLDGKHGPQRGPLDFREWYDAETRGWVEAADGSLAAWIAAGARTEVTA